MEQWQIDVVVIMTFVGGMIVGILCRGCSARRCEVIHASDLKRKGGNWLGAAREWMQWKKINGSDVTWNSDDELRPTMTVRDVEDLAAHVAAAVMNDMPNNMLTVSGGREKTNDN